MIDRTQIVQAFIDGRGLATYLEIGVGSGHNLLRVRAARKLAVDPAPRIGTLKRLRWWLRNPANRGCRVHRTTSDEFFAAHREPLAATGIDIAFVDGLHTWEQALRDVEHCLAWLSPRGVVLMHDCSPPSAAAAIRASSPEEAMRLTSSSRDGAWCGDVYKAILHLRSQRRDLEVCVLDCDRGIGVVQPGRSKCRLELAAEEIAALGYARFDANRRAWLDLRPIEALGELVRTPAAS